MTRIDIKTFAETLEDYYNSIYQTGLTPFEPQLGHAISLCSFPQFMHENFRGWYAEPLIPVPHRGPNPEEKTDLYQSFIPPKPAFLKALSFL